MVIWQRRKKAADDDFKAAYADEQGIYGFDATKSGEFGVFKGYDASGKAYTYDNTQKQVRMKLQEELICFTLRTSCTLVREPVPSKWISA